MSDIELDSYFLGMFYAICPIGLFAIYTVEEYGGEWQITIFQWYRGESTFDIKSVALSSPSSMEAAVINAAEKAMRVGGADTMDIGFYPVRGKSSKKFLECCEFAEAIARKFKEDFEKYGFQEEG